MWRGAIFQIKKQHTNQDINCLVFHPICALPPPCWMFVQTPPVAICQTNYRRGKFSVQWSIMFSSSQQVKSNVVIAYFGVAMPFSQEKLKPHYENWVYFSKVDESKQFAFGLGNFARGEKKVVAQSLTAMAKLSFDRCARVEPEWFGEKVLASTTRSRVVGDSSAKCMADKFDGLHKVTELDSIFNISKIWLNL